MATGIEDAPLAEQTAVLDTPEAEDADAAQAQPAKRRRPLKRRTRIGLIAVGAVALVTAALLIANWVIDTRNFVTTSNAQIDGTQISVNAPTSGTLTDWKGALGVQLRANSAVGRIAVQTGYGQPQLVVRAPADGVIAVNNGVNGAFVTAGTQLAVAYDPSAVFVTARVEETSINDVRVGQLADISVDAFPGVKLTGRVVEIKTGAAGVFSLFPQSNTTGNFQKVTQVIPVKVMIDDLKNLQLAPGMNVTVKIHRT